MQLEAGRVNWIAAQEHSGENIGTTESHAVFIELKEPPLGSSESSAELGPTSNSLAPETRRRRSSWRPAPAAMIGCSAGRLPGAANVTETFGGGQLE